MDIIKLLPDSLANQIAAGEVVQRPASVVKELMENSVDAGARNIKLVVQEAGKTLIQVIDDGKGMSLTDARMCFERHATSKIKQSEDLFRIKTLGFRGEALASIAAVAQVEVKTKRITDPIGTHIRIEASDFVSQEPIPSSNGTNISVKNLFYNVPARRNFLKSNPVEFKHILEDFQRIALANPDIGFTLHNNNEEISNLEASKLSQRIVKLFGKNYQEQLIPVEEETPMVKIHGYIGKPEFSRKTRGEQYFFLNERFIKSGYLNHAVLSAFSSLVDKQFPFYVIFLDIDSKHVDINVHPTKTEVKFDDDRSVYGVLTSAIKRALSAFNVMPSLDFNTDVNFHNIIPKIERRSSSDAGTSLQERNYASFKGTNEMDNIKNWEKMYESVLTESKSLPETESQEVLTFSSAINKSATNSDFESRTVEFHGDFIIKSIKSGLLFVHRKNAHRRIFYERFLKVYRTGNPMSQQLLFPVTLELNQADFSLVQEIKEEVGALGFVFEEFGKNTLVISGIPSDLIGHDEKKLFEELLEQFKSNRNELSLDIRDNLARSLAKKVSSQTIKPLDSAAIDTIIDELFACEHPTHTAEGLPTVKKIKLEELQSWFH